MKQLKRIGYTVGEPAGIGPDIILMLAQQPFAGEVVVFGCKDVLKSRAKQLGLELHLTDVDFDTPPTANGNGHLSIYHTQMPMSHCQGKPNEANRKSVLQTLDNAYQACFDKKLDAIVTGPVSKADLHVPEQPFTGHTEFFANCAKVSKFMMGFYHPDCLIGLATSHIPLSEVSANITPERLTQCIELLNGSLVNDFGIEKPKIGVLGLNPHAGENGQLGWEELELIIPTIKTLNDNGYHVEGPMPGDTAFIAQNLKRFDGMLGMYHDQTLGPLKALTFGNLVNYTLGLPIIRTSVDHGTAFNIAGTGKADAKALESAILLAFNLAEKKSNVI